MTKNMTIKKINTGAILRCVLPEDDSPFEKGSLYRVTSFEKDRVTINGRIDFQYNIAFLHRYFEVIDSVFQIEDYPQKALLLKEAAEKLNASEALLFNRLMQDKSIKGDVLELQFLYENLEVLKTSKCSCCGEILTSADEQYNDEIGDNSILCENCSIFNEDTNMYQKAVSQDTIEKLTGLKFSSNIGDIGSKIEGFNYWLNFNDRKFGVTCDKNNETFIEFINEYSEWNICDCCGTIEKSTDLIWDDEEVHDNEYRNFRFLKATISVDAVCNNCINDVNNLVYLNIEKIEARLLENQMLYRAGDYVLLSNVDFVSKNCTKKSFISKVASLNKENKTYELEGYEDIEFVDADFFDIVNDAYVNEYADFISCKYPSISDEVDEWTYPNHEGYPEIEMAFENFGYRNEFAQYLKSKGLSFERFAASKVEKDDKDQSIKEDEDFLRDSVLHFIFIDDIPTYKELIENKNIDSLQLCEEYENYDYSSVLQLVEEKVSEFKSLYSDFKKHKLAAKNKKKYKIRPFVEFGAFLEIVVRLQQLHVENDFNLENNILKKEIVCLQASIKTGDYSSVEIVLDCEIDYFKLEDYLKEGIKDKDILKDINSLIQAIKEAKEDGYSTLHVYDA